MAYGRLSHGGLVKVDRADPAVAQDAREWHLLAQFDSDDTTGFMWGDCGVLYFLVRAEDLSQRDFDDVAFAWQCS